MKTIASIKKTNQTYLDHPSNHNIYCECTECGGDVIHGMVSCPDGRETCCVCHWGYACKICKSVFDVTFEKDELDLAPRTPLKVHEEIGQAIVNIRGVANGKKDVIIG